MNKTGQAISISICYYRTWAEELLIILCSNVGKMYKDVSSTLDIDTIGFRSCRSLGHLEIICVQHSRGSNLADMKESGFPTIRSCFPDKSSSTCGFLPSGKIGNMSFARSPSQLHSNGLLDLLLQSQ